MLTLQKRVVIEMLRGAEAHADIEVTGFVAVGPQGQRVQPMQNVARQPDRYYEWAPGEMMEQYGRMDDRGEELLAIYHSHPGGKPDPSETDMQGALNVGMHYVIAYPEHFCPEGACSSVWRLSVWECLEMGVLVESSYEVAP